MNCNLQSRASNMALAFINASVPLLQTQKAKAPWIARRVAVNADREIGVVKEPRLNAHLSKKTAEELQRKGII